MKEVMASDALEISITAVIGCVLALYKESDTLWQKPKDISECSVLNEIPQALRNSLPTRWMRNVW